MRVGLDEVALLMGWREVWGRWGKGGSGFIGLYKYHFPPSSSSSSSFSFS